MAKRWKPKTANDRHHPACDCGPCNGEPPVYLTRWQRLLTEALLNGHDPLRRLA